MTTSPRTVKTLMKILIGAAWLDGVVQTEERAYLNRIVKEKGVENDPEIHALLYESRPVKPEECYAWVREYLGDRPTDEDYQQLLEEISGLIYSDGTVASEEAQLLNELGQHELPSGSASNNLMLAKLQKLYQRWVSSLN